MGVTRRIRDLAYPCRGPPKQGYHTRSYLENAAQQWMQQPRDAP